MIACLISNIISVLTAQTNLPASPTPFGFTPNPVPTVQPIPTANPIPTSTPLRATPSPTMTPTNLPAMPTTNRNFNPNNPQPKDNRMAPATGSGN